jgi:iron complex transport system ATP-binding protein
MLEAKNINYKIGGKIILESVTARFNPGKFSVIIGPNGSGKSSLLKILSQEIHSYSGSVHYGGLLLTEKDIPWIARKRAVLSQHSELSFPLSVSEIVLMGRYPHYGRSPHTSDLEIADQAMKQMNIYQLKDQNYLTLSGGEKQKTHFARALAQIADPSTSDCRYLLLDEPIAFMDLNYQHEFLRIAKTIASQNTVVIAVIHDLNLALQYGDEVLALSQGIALASGRPEQVIIPDRIFEMYGVKSEIIYRDGVSFPLMITR